MIKGDHVYLRPIQKEDMYSFYQATQDEEIRYMTGTRDSFTMEQLAHHFTTISQDESRRDFAICLSQNNELIGDLSIVEIDEMNKKAGFRIAIHNPTYFNKGYGSEATKLAILFSFEQLKLNRLQLEVFSHNKRGMKAYEKVGFKKEGVLRQSLYINNQYSDEIIMGITRADYKTFKCTV